MRFLKCVFLLPAFLFALQFTQSPTLTALGGGQWQAAFAVDESTDVEVSIVDPRDSTVVRHLAAGKLGSKAPAPLAMGSLSQTLAWDGRDDFGRPSAEPGMLSVRVRAGMRPVLVGFAAENLYYSAGNTSMATDTDGSLYVLCTPRPTIGITPSFIRKYDASGNYVKTIYPPPADLPADSVIGWGINVLPGGGWVPKTYPTTGGGVQLSYLVMKGATLGFNNGRLVVVSGGVPHIIGKNGCYADTSWNNPLEKPAATAGASTLQQGLATGRALAVVPEYNYGPYVMERIAVDRTNEAVYWNGDNLITDWNNPVPRKLPVNLDNITVAPNGCLYGWNIDGQSTWGWAFVKRYTKAGMSLPYAGSGTNNTTGPIYYEYGYAGVPGNHRGLAAGWQGQVAAFTEASFLIEVQDTNGNVTCGSWASIPTGTHRKLVSCDPAADANFAREGMMGAKYDPAGNFYVGLKKRAAKPFLPAPVFAKDQAFLCSGAVVKFGKDSASIFNPVSGALTGHERIYPQPFGPLTQPALGPGPLGYGSCDCRNSYFDVDPYGRLYIPNGVTCQVYVADNAGNNITMFGQYGNTDSRGGLSGPGELVAGSGVPMAWPTSVGTSEDFIYITDLGNSRLVRIQMTYAIDNLPGLTAHTASAGADTRPVPTLETYPNPFNPVLNITFTLPTRSRADLAVYDLNGRLVRTLASGEFGAGAHRLNWDARDAAGQSVSAGVYLYRLTAGQHTLLGKAIYAK